MITFGNLVGNTFDALLSRFAGKPAPGSSLDMEGTRLHHFEIYGRSDMNRGTVIVQIGYRKRF